MVGARPCVKLDVFGGAGWQRAPGSRQGKWPSSILPMTTLRLAQVRQLSDGGHPDRQAARSTIAEDIVRKRRSNTAKRANLRPVNQYHSGHLIHPSHGRWCFNDVFHPSYVNLFSAACPCVLYRPFSSSSSSSMEVVHILGGRRRARLAWFSPRLAESAAPAAFLLCFGRGFHR